MYTSVALKLVVCLALCAQASAATTHTRTKKERSKTYTDLNEFIDKLWPDKKVTADMLDIGCPDDIKGTCMPYVRASDLMLFMSSKIAWEFGRARKLAELSEDLGNEKLSGKGLDDMYKALVDANSLVDKCQKCTESMLDEILTAFIIVSVGESEHARAGIPTRSDVRSTLSMK